MKKKSRMEKLKNLFTKSFKHEVSNMDEEKTLRPKIVSKLTKLVKKAFESSRLVEKSKMFTENIRNRLTGKKQKDKKDLEKRNKIFLEQHPQFNQVFKYDHVHNTSNDAETTAKSYMKARKERLIDIIMETFPDSSDSFKEQVKDMINENEYDIDLLESMESVAENLIYGAKSDPDDVIVEFGTFDSPDDEYLNRILNRYSRL